MNLRHIQRGTKMNVFEELQKRAVSEEFDAVFRYQECDRRFTVQSPGLHGHFEKLGVGARLNISFEIEQNTYTFSGHAIEKQRTNNIVMIEQLSDIETYSRRKYDRDEFRFNVSVHGVPEAKTREPHYAKPETTPELTDVTYDVSSGGLCIISNTLLSSRHDPHYLLEFTIGGKDSFVLPARLVRRTNYPRTKGGRYDYGFQFIFDAAPEEKSRLTRAILTKKLSAR